MSKQEVLARYLTDVLGNIDEVRIAAEAQLLVGDFKKAAEAFEKIHFWAASAKSVASQGVADDN